MSIRPGEIYRTKTGKRRPVIVVSREELNRGSSIVCVPLTTARLDDRTAAVNCVRFDAGDFGLEKNCVAQAELLGVTEKIYIDLEAGPVGVLDKETREELIRAIGYVMGTACGKARIDE